MSQAEELLKLSIVSDSLTGKVFFCLSHNLYKQQISELETKKRKKKEMSYINEHMFLRYIFKQHHKNMKKILNKFYLNIRVFVKHISDSIVI